jgi:hypothetical protein
MPHPQMPSLIPVQSIKSPFLKVFTMPGMLGRLFGKSENEWEKALYYAVMVAVIAGIAATAIIVYYAGTESYSALHLEKYSNYIENGTVSFTYGVDRFGPAPATYSVKALHRGNVVYSKDFAMEPGSMNATAYLRLNETLFPVKVQLVLTEAPGSGGQTYEVYFWLKGSK